MQKGGGEGSYSACEVILVAKSDLKVATDKEMVHSKY